MRYFPLKRFLLFAVLVFALGFWGIDRLELYLEKYYTQAIENIYIGDTQPIFDGSIRLREAINNNIDDYLQKSQLLSWGIKAEIKVTEGEGVPLYPVPLGQDLFPLESLSREEIAAENYRLMRQGLSVSVDILLVWDSVLVLSFFFLQLFGVALVFRLLYTRSVARANADYRERQQELNRLYKLEEEHRTRLERLHQEKQQLAADIENARNHLETYREKASQNEDAMIDEMIQLEEKMQQNMELMQQMEKENVSLKEIASQYEERLQKGGKKSAAYGNVEKRFKTLYPNILMNKRALENFIALAGDMKIKAEAVIKHLDENTVNVDIKRKVELRKSREKIFEAMFSYNGRLYFRNTTGSRIEVLAIGNKNSQAKDMAFLENL